MASKTPRTRRAAGSPRPPQCRELRDKAQAMVDAYASRFEGVGPHNVFGPLDDEFAALKAVFERAREMKFDPHRHYLGLACPKRIKAHYSEFYGVSRAQVRSRAAAAGWRFKNGQPTHCPACNTPLREPSK